MFSYFRGRRCFVTLSLMVILSVLLPSMALADDPTELVPGTGVLLSQSGDGSGGNTSSATSRTNIFSPAAYVDYKRFGGEPTVVVDRYPFVPGQFGFGATATGYRDLTYASAPQGFVYPHYSPFWKSDDLGQSFRVPQHMPGFGKNFNTGGGGGDSHQVVGPVTHKVFYVDLPGPGCVTMNVSDDLGESFRDDELGCGPNPGVIDDRQWVEADETYPGSAPPATGNVYVSFINFSNLTAPSLSLARSTHDGNEGTFVTDSVCNTLVGSVPTTGAANNVPTACPDPSDSRLWVAGPVVADKEGTATRPASHKLYIPFIRAGNALDGGPPWELDVAISSDGGTTWTRSVVAELGPREPDNIFPQLAIDRGGNLYYTWSQTQADGEQDIYYAFSTTSGAAWSAPIDVTGENNDTAIFPWLVAGDPGQVDLVYYKADTGINSNLGFVDQHGNECEEGTTGCKPNPSVWNVFFAQSQNALNAGANFKTVQISDHPNHLGQICTSGLSCDGDRDLLDFFTVDVDHLGAANVIWADDNTTRTTDTRNKLARQLSGNSIYKDQTINLQSSWPVRDHAVADRAGDVYDGAGLSKGSCPGMDVLATSADRAGDRITISMTLNSAPTAAKAIACATAGATGGVWGAEFWAAASDGNAENYYIAYRDNPGDGPPGAEAGRLDNVNATTTSLEFHPTVPGTFGGTCFSSSGTSPCTITMTISASSLSIKSGAGLYSITGLSTYFFGTAERPPLLRVEGGNSEQADATAALDYTGTGTAGK